MTEFDRTPRGWIGRVVDGRSVAGRSLIGNFDGLRAVAALMVFSLHAEIYPPLNLGPAGVWLFFTLSGFLLYKGFLQSIAVPESRLILAYLIRRVLRIMPLFLVVVLAMAYVFDDWPAQVSRYFVIDHLLFIRADVHLWTIKTEMVFYLSLPILILLLHSLKSEGLRFVILITLSCLCWVLFERYSIWQMHGGSAYFSPFLLGMAAVHVQSRVNGRRGRILTALALGMLLIFSSDYQWAAPLRQWFGLFQLSDLWGFGFLFYLPCMLLVLGVSQVRSPLWGNPGLRLIGVCGYGFYLWHVPVIIWLQRHLEGGFLLALSAFLLTSLLSLVSYLLIEHPGIRLGHWLSHRMRDGTPVLRLRPQWLAVIALALFFYVRHDFNTDNEILVRYEIWTEKPAVSQFYVAGRMGFSERYSDSQVVTPGRWSQVNLALRDTRVRHLRLDPGDRDGHYRLRNLQIQFAFQDDQWTPVELARFEAFSGINSLHRRNGELDVKAADGHHDPILLYRHFGGQPFLRSASLSAAAALVSALLVIAMLPWFDNWIVNLSRAGKSRGNGFGRAEGLE